MQTRSNHREADKWSMSYAGRLRILRAVDSLSMLPNDKHCRADRKRCMKEMEVVLSKNCAEPKYSCACIVFVLCSNNKDLQTFKKNMKKLGKNENIEHNSENMPSHA